MLAISLTQIAYNAFGAPYETTMLVRLGGVYGSNETQARIAFRPLIVHAATRGGPLMLLGSVFLFTIAGSFSPDLGIGPLAIVGLPLMVGLVFQIATTSLTAHLYASRRLPSVYIANAFLGGPSILCALFWPEAVAIAISYALGQAMRWSFLGWRVHITHRGGRGGTWADIDPPRWRELSPQLVSSAAGQTMPLLVQILLASLGANAVAIGAIALRVWGAAWQVGVSTLAMPETVALTRTLPTLSPQRRLSWLRLRTTRLVLAAAALTALAITGVALVATLGAGMISVTIASGLIWSIAALVGLPGGLLGFWAGRGLVAVGAGRWLPAMIAIAFVVGFFVSAIAVPIAGGVGALIAQAIALSAQGIATYVAFRRQASSEG